MNDTVSKALVIVVAILLYAVASFVLQTGMGLIADNFGYGVPIAIGFMIILWLVVTLRIVT